MSRTPESFQHGQLARGAILRMTQTVTTSIIAFFMMPFLIRHLGAHWYGMWAAVGSLTASYYLLDLGFASATMRYVAVGLARDDRARVRAIVSTSLLVYLALAVVLAVVTVTLAALVPTVVAAQEDVPTVRHVVLLVGFTLALEFPFKAFAGILQAKLRFDLVTGSRILFSLLSTIALFVIVSKGYGVVGMAYIGLASGVASNIVFVLMARSVVPWLSVGWRHAERAMFRDLLSFSTWSSVIQIANLFRFRIDQLVVGGLYSAVAVTHYAAGGRLSQLADNLQRQATGIIQPLVTRFYAQGRRHEVRDVVLLVTRLNVASAVFVTAQILILGRPFFVRWLGPEFADAAQVSYVLSLALLIRFMVAPCDNLFFVVAQHRTLAIAGIVEAALNLGCSILMGKWLGPVGVAWGTLIPMALVRLGWTLPISSRYAGISRRHFLGAVGGVVLPGAAFMIVYGQIVKSLVRPAGYTEFAWLTALSGAAYAALMLTFVFDVGERRKIWREVAGVLRLS